MEGDGGRGGGGGERAKALGTFTLVCLNRKICKATSHTDQLTLLNFSSRKYFGA